MSKTEDKISKIAEPIIKALGFELVDVEYIKRGNDRQLIIYIDKPGGVDLDSCEKASRLIEAELDRLDPIEESYILCVSSPGLDRPLKKPADFKRNMGRKVDVKLYKPLNGEKELTGVLTGYEENKLSIDVKGKEYVFDLKDTALVRLHIDF